MNCLKIAIKGKVFFFWMFQIECINPHHVSDISPWKRFSLANASNAMDTDNVIGKIRCYPLLDLFRCTRHIWNLSDAVIKVHGNDAKEWKLIIVNKWSCHSQKISKCNTCNNDDFSDREYEIERDIRKKSTYEMKSKIILYSRHDCATELMSNATKRLKMSIWVSNLM